MALYKRQGSASGWVDARSHARFGLEFTRQPAAQLGFILGPLSKGQLLCLGMIVVGAALAVSTNRRRGEPFVG